MKSNYLAVLVVLLLLGASFASAEIVINEVMVNPAVVLDDFGEYIELYNTDPAPVDIGGWILSDLGTDSHAIVGPLEIPAEGYLTLCRYEDPLDPLANGGVACDYVYGNDIELANEVPDEIILTGANVDTVIYDSTFPFSSGTSMELANPELDNNVGLSWGEATTSYNPDNLGTPGLQNSIYDATTPTVGEPSNTPEFPVLEDVEICVTATDVSGIGMVVLNWDSGTGFGIYEMTDSDGDDEYCRTLSEITIIPIDGMIVTYTITATDIYGNPTMTVEYSYTYDGADPVADLSAGEPYTCNEASSVLLDGSASTDTVDPSLDYAWDLNNDGIYEEDTGNDPTINYDCVDGPAVETVSLRVTDDAGFSHAASTDVTVNNVNPTASAGPPYECGEGGSTTLDASASSDPAGINDPLTYAWDFNNDGVFDDSTEVQPEYVCGDGDNVPTVSVRVSDDDGGEDTASANIIINNLAPVITNVIFPDPAEAVEQVEYAGLTIEATDFVDDLADLFILSTDSPWLEVDPENSMRLIGTPHASDVGTTTVSVTVTDGTDPSEPAEFEIDVLPVLQIDLNSIIIETEAGIFSLSDDFSVFPGEEVSVYFEFTNNFNDVLGHVETAAGINFGPGLDPFTYQGTCNTVEGCNDGYWSLEPGVIGDDEFTFMVPLGFAGDSFSLDIDVFHDDLWFLIFGNFFASPPLDIEFTVIRDLADVGIIGATLADNNLTCTGTASLDLTLINTGEVELQPAFTPEILIHTEEQNEAEFNEVTGRFPNEELFWQAFSDAFILPGAEQTETIFIDTTTLEYGEQTLYIYVINPYFDGYVLEDVRQVPLTLEPCLNVGALEEFFTIPQNHWEETIADLTEFLIEDTEGYVFDFEVTEQSNEDLINCEFSALDLENLVCNEPALGRYGQSELTVSINEANALTPIEETFIVTVIQTLDITSVQVNGEGIEEGGTNQNEIRPADEVVFEITIANNLDHPVTGIATEFFFAGPPAIVAEETTNIPGGESRTVTLSDVVPLEFEEGSYNVGMFVEGRDFIYNTLYRSDLFEFTLNLQQSPADVFISGLELGAETLACSDSTTLAVGLTNRGSNDENDLIITVTGGNVDLSSGGIPLTIFQNSELSHVFTIPIEDLSSGANTLTVEISYRDDFMHDSGTIVINRNTCLDSFTPTDTTLVVADNVNQEFTVTLHETGFDNTVSWTVTDEQGTTIVPVGEPVTGLTYPFNQATPEVYTVNATIEADENPVTWTVTVTDIPITNNFQIPALSSEDNLAAYQNFWIERTGVGRIEFTESVDLTDIFDLDQVVVISDTLIAVDAPGLRGVPATITLFGETFTNPVIQISDGFNQGPFDECTQCTGSNVNGNFVVTIPGFSTFQVVEAVPASLAISNIGFDNVERGDNLTATVTVTNQGTFESLTDVQVSLVNVNSRYSASLSPESLGNLGPGASATTTLTLTVPGNEDSGSHRIGSLRATGVNGDSQTVTASETITLNPRSYLTIENVDDGDGIKLDQVTEIEVRVQNDYSENMENVRVEVTILDVDGDDIEEESADFDLNDGEDKEVTLEFDLTGEDIDESEYTIEIRVEGDADDGTEHRTLQSETIDVDRERHQVIIERTSLGAATLQCDRLTTLQVVVKNVGESDEDDVRVAIRNDNLELEESQDNIELEDYSRRDNDHRASFSLDLSDAEVGTYPITVEVYRDSSLEASEDVEVEVKECLSLGQTTQTQAGLASGDLAEQLQQGLQARQQEQEVRSSFRESSTYTLMLGILVLLVLIAVLLAMAVVFKRR